MKRKWKKEDVIKLFELLIENNIPILSSRHFRDHLDRDHKLLSNQMIRSANGNIAYKRVDFDLDKLNDEEFWEKIEETQYLDLIEDNAAVAILKMAERFNILN